MNQEQSFSDRAVADRNMRRSQCELLPDDLVWYATAVEAAAGLKGRIVTYEQWQQLTDEETTAMLNQIRRQQSMRSQAE